MTNTNTKKNPRSAVLSRQDALIDAILAAREQTQTSTQLCFLLCRSCYGIPRG